VKAEALIKADRIEAIKGRCDAARRHVMIAASHAYDPELELVECHKALMLAAAVLDDAKECAETNDAEEAS
jgi:hypothetical protein